jgi:hypothetical protein
MQGSRSQSRLRLSIQFHICIFHPRSPRLSQNSSRCPYIASESTQTTGVRRTNKLTVPEGLDNRSSCYPSNMVFRGTFRTESFLYRCRLGPLSEVAEKDKAKRTKTLSLLGQDDGPADNLTRAGRRLLGRDLFKLALIFLFNRPNKLAKHTKVTHKTHNEILRAWKPHCARDHGIA